MDESQIEKHFKKGFQIIMHNSNELLGSAKILERNEKYAPAIALLVLAAEEAMKAYTAITQSMFPESEKNEFKKFYKDHKTKLETIRTTVMMSQLFEKNIEIVLAEVMNKDENEKGNDAYNRGMMKFANYLNEEAEGKNSDLDKEMEWWKHTKTLKEDCLYTRPNGKSWHNPQNVKKPLYDKTLQYVEKFIENIDYLNSIDVESEPYKNINSKFKEFINEKKLD